MLTTHAFNALLKTLEEPPEHVVFVMCTTDPQMIPETILSRVQRFDFKSISQEDIRNHLAYICEKEGFTYSNEALDLVVRHARGGMRDALSSLEQLSVFGNGSIELSDALDMLGVSSSSQMHDVAMAIAQRDGSKLFDLIDTMVNNGADLQHFNRQLCVHMRNVYVYLVGQENKSLMESIVEDKEELAAESQAFGDVDRVSYVISQLSKTASEMRHSADPRLLLESTMVRLTRPDADLTLEALASRIAQLQEQVKELQERPVVAQPSQTTQAMASVVPSLGVAPLTDILTDVTAQKAPVVEASKPEAESHPKHTEDTVASSPDTWEYLWKEVVREVESTLPHLGPVLNKSRIVFDDGESLKIGLPVNSLFANRILTRADIAPDILTIVRKSFGHRIISYVEDASGEDSAKSASSDKVKQDAPQDKNTSVAYEQSQQTPVEPSPKEDLSEAYASDNQVESQLEDTVSAPEKDCRASMSVEDTPPWQDQPKSDMYEEAYSEESYSDYGDYDEADSDIASNPSSQSTATNSLEALDSDDLNDEQKDVISVVSQAFGDGVAAFIPHNDDE